MRSSDEHDLREFRRRYSDRTDRTHRRWIGIIISFACGAAAMALWRYVG